MFEFIDIFDEEEKTEIKEYVEEKFESKSDMLTSRSAVENAKLEIETILDRIEGDYIEKL